jgi:Lamin Tail Domain
MKIARIPLLISLLLALLSDVSRGLKLTELMLNPTNAVDPNTQWFEIYNPADVAVELKGYRIRHCDQGDCSTYTLQSARSMGPNEYVVIGNNGESASNGGIALYQLSFKRIRKEGFNLLAILPPTTVPPTPDSFEDDFSFSSLDVNFTAGVSFARISNLGSKSLTNWKMSTTFINCVEGGDKGTPGKLNTYVCPTNPPTKAPTKAPIKGPTKAPTKSPTKKPTTKMPIEMKGPTIAPAKAPINAPAKAPTNAPNKAPVSAAATSHKRCGLLGLRIVCLNGCGVFGRLLNMCQD